MQCCIIQVNISNTMSNSQDSGRREIIRLSESAPKRQRTSRSTSRNTISIPKEARSSITRSAGIVENAEPTRVVDSSERSSDPLGFRTATPVRDPQETAIEEAVVTDSSTRVVDSSVRLSGSGDLPQMATSRTLPGNTTSTGVDTGEMSMTTMEEAAWEAFYQS
jgi:hypothetical protein